MHQQDEYERRYAEGASDEIDAAAASGLETDPSCIFRQGLTYSVRPTHTFILTVHVLS